MKPLLTMLAAAALWLSAGEVRSQTINWGSVVDSTIVDSKGNPLDGTFRFELGAFNLNFTPTPDNLSAWTNNWNIFDSSDYNPLLTLFSGTQSMELVGGVSGPLGHNGSFNFAEQPAYLWIKNSDIMEIDGGQEWLLVRSDPSWVFPTASGDCCDKEKLQFSTSDLASGDSPLWGGQGGVQGPGNFTTFVGGGGSLQTYSLVPEPSSALIAFLIVLGAVTRRERGAVARA